MKVLTNLDLIKNQLLNCVIQKVAADPTTKLAAGWIIYNTTDNVIKFYNGEEWKEIGAGGGGSITIDTEITDESTNDNAAGSKAVYDFVTQILTTVDAMKFKGTVAANGTITSTDTTVNNKKINELTNIKNGWTFKAAEAIPTTVLGTNKPAEIGDVIIMCGNMTTYDASKVTIVQTNIDGAVTGPDSSVNETVPVFDGTSGKIIKGTTITKEQLESVSSKSSIYRKNNPSLEAASGDNFVTWTISDITLDQNSWPSVNIYETSTGELNISDVKIDLANSTIEITFKNVTIMPANTYVAVVVV